jgi:hypothetical protein
MKYLNIALFISAFLILAFVRPADAEPSSGYTGCAEGYEANLVSTTTTDPYWKSSIPNADACTAYNGSSWAGLYYTSISGMHWAYKSGSGYQCGDGVYYRETWECVEAPPCELAGTWQKQEDGSVKCIGTNCTFVDQELADSTICSNEWGPSTCFDGEVSGSETGIDCGSGSGCLLFGGSENPCQNYCPDGWIENGNTGDCESFTDPDAYGNCPTGYSSYTFADNGTSTCVATTDSVSGPVGNAETPSAFDDQIPAPNTGSFSSGTFSVTTMVSPETVVDNGDGTETATINKSVTNSDGSTSNTSTSVNRPSGSGTGTGFTSSGGVAPGYDGSSSETGALAPEENSDNYEMGSAEGDFSGSSLDESDAPEESDIAQLLQDQKNSTFVDLITQTSITTSAPVCSLDWDYKGTAVSFSMCGDLFTDTLDMMGLIMIFISTISAYFIVIGRS